ncbi:hydrogenase maturation protease [Clostridium beijerinckii]|uniref:hydrogenase maturation protease n=1 Tax=Clostridium beijerinckii TaxID=1520 RepID=UPI00047A3DC6|nr:hydrogenase maturation protease [Clostridium beijerinckii]
MKNTCSNIKVIAIGNVLMRDDGIGIEVAKKIESKLLEKNIKLIYGETDVQYSIASVKEDDYIFILDAACYGKSPGEITRLKLDDFVSKKKGYSQHSYNFLDLLKLFYPNAKGQIYGIEVNDVEIGFGLSEELQEKLEVISKKILDEIEIYILNLQSKNK